MNNTPGLWTIRHGTNIFGNRSDVGHQGIVCNTGGHFSNQVGTDPENFTNARLIAAAPELFAACQAVMSDDPYTVCMDKIRSAIAKATEEPSCHN